MKSTTVDHPFTVVIPTRERGDTLEHALRTCVTQDYDNLEILVSDNFSQDRTREVVESYHDPRIRYINTGKRVSMTDNFEFALSHVKPEGYVMYIGDDDGLLPNAIRDINTIVIQTGAQVLHWDTPSYFWPSSGHRDANRLMIPSLRAGATIRDSATAIQNVLAFRASYYTLPMLYMRSVVAYEVIRRIKDRSRNFFHSMIPDIYSGFAIAGAVDHFVESQRPFALCGISSHSNGASSVGSLATSEAARKFMSEDNLPFHPFLVYSRSITACVIECFLQARDHLPFFQNYTCDMRQLLFEMMKEAALKPPEIYQEIRDAVAQLGDMHHLPDAARQAIADNPRRDPGSRNLRTLPRFLKSGWGLIRFLANDLYHESLRVDCAAMRIQNIHDATLLCSHIFKLKDLKLIGRTALLRSSLETVGRIIRSS